MLNKYKVISLGFMIFFVLPLMAQEAQEAPVAPVASVSPVTPEVKSEMPTNEIKIRLPQAGDFSVGISADPILNFVGNMFNGTIGQTIDEVGGAVLNSTASTPTVSIMGKYMISDKFAIRANIGFIVNVDNQALYGQDDKALALDPLSQAKIVDTKKISSRGGSISLGLEYRIGNGRVQGVFSGSALYSMVFTSENYSYGNAITEMNRTPSIAYGTYYPLPSIAEARVLKKFIGSPSSTVGLVGGVGIEWFIAPKISLGVEVNLALLYTWTPSLYTESEGYSSLTNQLEEYTDLTAPSTNKFVFGTKNLGGNLSVNFYF